MVRILKHFLLILITISIATVIAFQFATVQDLAAKLVVEAQVQRAIQGNTKIPDYDALSPDAWNQAKELANRLHKMGFMFVEARQSVLNDYHHSTYNKYYQF